MEDSSINCIKKYPLGASLLDLFKLADSVYADQQNLGIIGNQSFGETAGRINIEIDDITKQISEQIPLTDDEHVFETFIEGLQVITMYLSYGNCNITVRELAHLEITPEISMKCNIWEGGISNRVYDALIQTRDMKIKASKENIDFNSISLLKSALMNYVVAHYFFKQEAEFGLHKKPSDAESESESD